MGEEVQHNLVQLKDLEVEEIQGVVDLIVLVEQYCVLLK